MKAVSCDQCGFTIEHAHAGRIAYRLDYTGSMDGDVWDFCSQECVTNWAVDQLRRERDGWREQALGAKRDKK